VAEVTDPHAQPGALEASTGSSPVPLLGSHTLERLARLDLAARRAAAGGSLGERAAGRAGLGTIFHEHRTYSPGDDLRYVDWNVYGRLRSLHVKVFEHEENLDVHLLLDRSVSMGSGARSKLALARRVIAMVGCVALARGDTVRLTLLPAIPSGGTGPRETVFRGRAAVHRLLAALSKVTSAPGEPLGEALEKVLPAARRRGFALLVSDLLDEGVDGAATTPCVRTGWQRAVDYLRYLNVELTCVQVLAPHERDPTADGPVRLVDAESGRTLDLDVDAAALRRYRVAFDGWVRSIAAYLRSKESRHLLIDTTMTADDRLLQRLRESGVLR